MESKEITSVAISGAALGFSIAAFFVSYIRGKRQDAQKLRFRLDDVLNHLMSVALDHADAFHYEGARDTILRLLSQGASRQLVPCSGY
jgi:hypothetical protein